MHCENVVCDVHLTDMKSMRVMQGMGIAAKVLDGFGHCPVSGCGRFFGTEGYCDLTNSSEFAKIRKEPTCSTRHERTPMYIQRTPDCLQWVCPMCSAVTPFCR